MPTSPIQEHPHPEDLLPWFVNNTLSLNQKKEVEIHLQQCRRCQNEVALLQNMRQHVKTVPIRSPGEVGLQRLLHKVKQEKKQEQIKQRKKVKWWQPSLAIAASMLIFVQAGLLFDAWFLSKPVVPLSGPQESGIVIQISFAPTATEAEIRESISAINGSFIGGPGQLGIYRIRLNVPTTDQKGIEQAVESLRQRQTIIRHVAKE